MMTYFYYRITNAGSEGSNNRTKIQDFCSHVVNVARFTIMIRNEEPFLTLQWEPMVRNYNTKVNVTKRKAYGL